MKPIEDAWADAFETAAEIERLGAEIERLKALVEEAYTEGWQDALPLPYDGTVGVTEDWERSESRAALNTEGK